MELNGTKKGRFFTNSSNTKPTPTTKHVFILQTLRQKGLSFSTDQRYRKQTNVALVYKNTPELLSVHFVQRFNLPIPTPNGTVRSKNKYRQTRWRKIVMNSIIVKFESNYQIKGGTP